MLRFQYTEDDIVNMLEFLVDNIFVVFGGNDSQQIVGIPIGTNCAPLLADIFLYSYEAKFIQSLLSTGKKKLASQFNFTYRYIDDVLSINTQILRIIWVRCIPLSLRSKIRRRATPLLPTWIYSCRSRVTVSCEFPFTTNVTISTSISHTFRSWVAIFHLRQPMVFLSHSSYGMPRLAPLMNFLFLGRRDFRLSSSDRDMSLNVWNRPSGSFMVDMGISSNIMKSPSPKCYMTFWDHIQWHPQLIRHYTNLRTYYRTGL